MKILLKGGIIAAILFISAGEILAIDFSPTLEARQDRHIYAGLYFQMKLGGRADPNPEDRMGYGFQAGVRRDRWQATSYHFNGNTFDWTGRSKVSVNLIDANFDGDGFKRFSLAQTPLLFRETEGQIYVLRADGEGETEDQPSAIKSVGKALLWGAAIVGGVVLAFSLSECVDGKTEDEQILDFCPLD